MIRILSVIALLVSALASAEQLPYTSFGHLPMVEMPRVSPNGAWVAAIVNGEEGPTVNVAPFGSRELTPVIRLKYGRDRIDWIGWANDDRLLVAASEAALWRGDRVRIGRLYSIGRDGKGLQQIEREPVKEVPWWTAIFDTTNIISYLRDDPGHILLQLYDERDEAFAVYKVNIESNEFTKLFVNSYEVDAWYANGDGQVVLGVGRDEDLLSFWHRPVDTESWRKIHEWRLYEAETFTPVWIEGDEALVLSDYELSREALWRFDISEGEFEELVYAAERFDVDEPIFSREGSEVIGVSYYDDYRIDHYFDSADADRAALVKRNLPQYQTAIASRSLDGNRLIVQASRDDSPGKFFWLDLEQGTGGVWFSQFPYLEQAQLSPVQPFEFEASDGMALNGYLTMPVDTEDSKPPLIVFPHGGPQARDYRYFNPYVQFFANRGYAVLQVNFRGSSGFGTRYEVSGYRQWGMAMQNDVYAAIDWLAARDVVDMNRVCMVGGSYGGYVALTAAFQRPEAFRCHIALAPVTDLREEAEVTSRWNEAFVKRTIGDPGDDEDQKMLERHSPINHVAEIKRPILLIHGTHDTQVRVQQSRSFHKEARRANADVEYMEIEFGTHYFDEYTSRLEVFEAMERFLRKHL